MDPTGIGTVAEGCDAPPAVVQYGVKGYGPVWGLLPLQPCWVLRAAALVDPPEFALEMATLPKFP